jgi:DNA-binding LacI/PurR family transcriptional regulator
MVTIKDIAKESGFSVSVVSRALNPKPDQKVKATTEETIKAVAKRLGYRPNHAAAFMQKGRNPSIGVFLPRERNSLLADLVFGISDVARKYGLVLNFHFGLEEQTFSDFLDSANKTRVTGIISYMPVYEPLQKFWQEKCHKFIKNGGKAVFINNPGIPELDIPSVCIDNYAGGQMAAEYLVKKGCKKLLCPNYDFGSWQMQQRSKGFVDYLQSIDSKPEAHCFDPENVDIDQLDKLKSTKSPLGVFTGSDYIVLDLIKKFYHANRTNEIGNEFLLLGYDNLNESKMVAPALTTFHQDFQKIGETAMQKLANIIINGAQEKSQMIKPKLIIRESA